MTAIIATITEKPSARPVGFVHVMLWGTSGALLMAFALVILALQFTGQRIVRTSPWAMATWIAAVISLEQWLAVLLWALVTGGFLALGTRRAWPSRRLAWSTLGAGALVPVGLLGLGHGLNILWPTAVPRDGPPLQLLLTLVAYSLGAPYALGRFLKASGPKKGQGFDGPLAH